MRLRAWSESGVSKEVGRLRRLGSAVVCWLA